MTTDLMAPPCRCGWPDVAAAADLDDRAAIAVERLRARFGYSQGFDDGFAAGYELGARRFAEAVMVGGGADG